MSTGPVISLVCVADADHTDQYAAWVGAAPAELQIRIVRLPVGTPESRAAVLIELLRPIPGPYALFAAGPEVPAALAVCHSQNSGFSPVRIIVARAVPAPEQLLGPVPVCGLAATDDPAFAPSDLAGWRSRRPDGFSIRVIEGRADFLAAEVEQLMPVLAEELGVVAWDTPVFEPATP